MSCCEKKCIDKFIFIWKIEEFPMCPLIKGDFLKSRIFSVKTFQDTQWCLKVYPRGDHNSDDGFISLYLSRENDGGCDVEINFRFFVNSVDARRLNYGLNSRIKFKSGKSWGYRNCIRHKCIDFLPPHESLVIECHMVICNAKLELTENTVSIFSHSPFFQMIKVLTPELFKEMSLTTNAELLGMQRKNWACPNLCFSRYRIPVERMSITWTMKKTSILENGNRQHIPVMSCSDAPSLLLTLYASKSNNTEVLATDIRLIDTNLDHCIFLTCQLKLFQDKKEIHSSTGKHMFKERETDEIWHIENNFKYSHLIKELSAEELILKCDFAISNATYCHSEIEWTRFSDLACQKWTLEDSPSQSKLNDEMLRFFVDKKFCDVTIRTNEKDFKTHKAVICAMSPVFFAMFESEMKENATNVICIDDLDADTVNQMLTFMYTERLEQLEFDSLAKLLKAADKYQIESLREICCDKLKRNLSADNACDSFCLADKYCIKELKHSIVKLFSVHKDHFTTTEWKQFTIMKPALANEILQEVCMNLDQRDLEMLTEENEYMLKILHD